jgi:hypothetical protein
VQRRRQGVPGEGVLLAAEPPPEAPHQVVHRHERLDPGELHPHADPRPAAERHERARRRRRWLGRLEPGRVQLGRVGEDGGVHVRHAGRPEHLPAFGDGVAFELGVPDGCLEVAEDGRDQAQGLLRDAPRVLELRQVLPGEGLAVVLAFGDLVVLCAPTREHGGQREQLFP